MLRQLTLGVLLIAATAAVSAQKDAAQQEATEKDTAQKDAAQKDAAHDVALPASEGRGLVAAACSQCHMLDVVTRHHEVEARWKQYVDDMIVRGMQMAPADAGTVVQYLTKNFGPAPTTAATPSAKTGNVTLPEGDGKGLVEAKCSVCHDLDRVTKVFRDEQGWTDLVNSMVSRGAVITPEEVQKISAYLFAHYGIS